MTPPITNSNAGTEYDGDIAVVGMAGRFPGARNVDEFWANLRAGVESVTTFSDEDLLAAGVEPGLLVDPDYVKSGAILPDMEMFDAGFFGLSPREASIMDPQHRHFLECAWEALEDAGHPPSRFPGSIGVFGGSGHNAYLPYNLLTNPKLMASVGFFLVRHTGNDKDFLTTRVSYLFNLRGPSVNVQTACSTSLVAMHYACQSLLSRECDMALAGGVTIELPHRHGYLYREGEILSPDGHCRPFDAASQGTVFGSGVGIVALRRLADALADGDHIHAVIKGSAVNNDGAQKVGYLAPSVDGQARAIAEALAIAGVGPETISYVEAHGTGTPVGDPIEIAALTQAFGEGAQTPGRCGIGSVKSNIGHIDTAAGVASFIKVALAMQHRELPASLHFAAPNPACEFERGPFRVVSSLTPWMPRGIPRRAGVSSLGVGGTNAHIIVEEAPAGTPSGPSRPSVLLPLSARTSTALEAGAAELARHLHEHPDINLADAAWTLQAGRQAMKHRRSVVASSVAEAVEALRMEDPFGPATANPEQPRPVTFMFAGGGAQHPTMGADLYRTEPVFRAAVDECLTLMAGRPSADLKSLIFPPEGQEEPAGHELERPSLALPALFTIQYAQARLWMSWGISPTAMIGHSMGEYTAAHLAGVFTLDGALALVELRGRLFERLPAGAMLSVAMPADQLADVMGPELSVAAINGPALTVASGPVEAIERLAATLAARDIDAVRIRISVAAHSAMLEPILNEFAEFLRRMPMKAPTMPFVSNVTGTWITPAEATDPAYWVRHLRGTVRFSDGLRTLLEDRQRVLLEVGPGRTLATLARQHPDRAAEHVVLHSLKHPQEVISDGAFVLGVLGQLWACGVAVDWDRFRGDERRRRIPLPTYRFDHQRHWIEPGKVAAADQPGERSLTRQDDVGEWFSQPVWRRKPALPAATGEARALLFLDEQGFGSRLAERLRQGGRDIVTVRAGPAFARHDAGSFTIDPAAAADYVKVIQALSTEGRVPQEIGHLWSVTGSAPPGLGLEALEPFHRLGFQSLLYLAQAIGGEDLSEPIRLTVVSDHLHRVAGEEALQPGKATILGPCRVIPREFQNIRCRSVDVILPRPGSWQESRLVEAVAAELSAAADDEIVAYRGSDRWLQKYVPVRLGQAPAGRPIRMRGVYLITGGLGGVGLSLAGHLARTVKARLILVGRTALPDRSAWDEWLRQHDPELPTSRRIRQVMELEGSGAEVMLAAADITDLDQMRTVVKNAQARFGSIDGVLHTAGVLSDGVIQLKDPAVAAQVLAPKVRGTLVLEAALAGQPLDFLVLFSSVSSFSGLAGQVDYAAANAFLDAYAQERVIRDGTYTVAVNWSAWQEVGMAAAMAQQLGIVPESAVEPAGIPVGHPLVERCLRDTPDERIYATPFSTASHWLLDEHRVRGGEALIPGAGYLELIRAAFAHHPQARALEMHDVTFLSPFVVRGTEEKELRVRFRRSGHGASEFSVQSRMPGGAEAAAWIEHARGRVAYADLTRPTPVSLGEIRARCTVRSVVPAPGAQPRHLVFGPRWSNVRRTDFGTDEALLALELPAPFAHDLPVFALHPALMDMATAGAQDLIPGYGAGEDFFVPASYGSVRIYGPLPSKLVSHVRLRREEVADGDLASFDVTVMDELGTVLVDVTDFTMMRVRDKSMLSRPVAAAIPAARGEAAPSAPHPTANTILAVSLRDGIRPAEGALALERILAAGAGPQIVVSPQDLVALVAELRRGAQAPASAVPPARPERDLSALEAGLATHEAVREAAAAAYGDRIVAYVVYTPDHSPTVSELRRHVRGIVAEDLVPQTFVELEAVPRTPTGSIDRAALPNPFGHEQQTILPRTEMERTIAALWQELLGIDQVGVHDNFFDVGGHSLLSVRFISRLDKRAGVRLQHEHIVVNTLEQLAAKSEAMLAGAK
ncbi:MAG: SDR family NAD(P)-dependent oxidoreductase [Gemmatimonadales bacterium]|nr:SDR family NAD(P)-dependent oxidoreductase [Gemmatimonadales bacterium]